MIRLAAAVALAMAGCGEGDPRSPAGPKPTGTARAALADPPAPRGPASGVASAVAAAPARPPRPQAQGTFALPPVSRVPAPAIGGPDFAAVFEQVSPAVVGVAVGRRRGGRFQVQRTGTGFVWDAAGHIVTNDHLVADGDVVRVRLVNGKVLPAQVLAGDGPMDLAVLVAEGPVPPPADRSRSEGLRPGEWVAAIGNPFGLQHSIAVGVVSAVGRRQLPGAAPRFGSFIQVDVAVNPGNSGGPLVDGLGRVVGLNSAMVSDAQGLAFAIPADQAEVVVARLLAEGRFVRGFGGLVVRPVTEQAAAEAGIDDRVGARVSKVVAAGPAARAGLAPGDIILEYAGEPVGDADSLPWLIAATRPGEVATLRVARGAARMDLRLTVEAAR